MGREIHGEEKDYSIFNIQLTRKTKKKEKEKKDQVEQRATATVRSYSSMAR